MAKCALCGKVAESGLVVDKECLEKLKDKLPRWIPVTDRLPEVDEYGYVDVLICLDDGFIASATYVKNNGWELWADAGEVTHWMPLPEPPERLEESE